MSFLDRAKRAFDTARDRAGELAEQHGDKVDSAIDKGGSFIDQKTHGKYRDTVGKVGARAKDATERLAAQRGETAPESRSAPSDTPPSTPSRPSAPAASEQSAGSARAADEAAEPIDPPGPIDPPEPVRRPDGESRDRPQG